MVDQKSRGNPANISSSTNKETEKSHTIQKLNEKSRAPPLALQTDAPTRYLIKKARFVRSLFVKQVKLWSSMHCLLEEALEQHLRLRACG